MRYVAARRNTTNVVFHSTPEEGVVIDTAQYNERVVAITEDLPLAQAVAAALNGGSQ